MLPILVIVAYLISKFSTLAFLAVLLMVILAAIFAIVLKNPLIGLMLAVFTLPFERIPTYHLGSVTIKIDQIFIGMTIIAWILKLLFERRKIQPYFLSWPIMIFLLINLISLSYAYDTSRAITVFIFTIFVIAASVVTTNLVSNGQQLSKIIKILFLTTALVGIFGIYQFLGDIVGLPNSLTLLKDIYSKVVLGFPRIQAFSMEPLYWANFLFVPLGLAISYYLFNQKKIIATVPLLALIVLILVNIILGISRGAYVALGVMILFFVIFLARRVLRAKTIIIALISVAILVGGVYEFLMISSPDSVERFISHAKIEDYAQGESVQKRLKDYQIALDFWYESPVIGIGPGNYGPRYKNYPPHDEVSGWEIVNNQYLESLAETGVLGLAALGLIVVAIYWRSVSTYRKCRDQFLKATLLGLLAALTAILVQYNFFSTLYIVHIWVLIGLIVAVQNIIIHQPISQSVSKNVAKQS